MSQPAVLQLVTWLSPLLLVATAWLFARLAALIRAHVHNVVVQGALLRLNDAAQTIVAMLEQTEVPLLKQSAATGKLTLDDARMLKAKAITMVKDYLGKNGVATLKQVFDTDALQEVIAAKVEAAVAEGKKS